jgi:two-component system OmpR family response regulator
MESTKHLIITDDDQEIRNLLSEFLTKHGYQVSTADSGEQLLALLSDANQDYDLIILDVMMPGIDGIEACRRVRQQSAIPIIMLTAVSDDTDKILGLEFGADDYLAKPFNPRELLARIKAVLRRSQDIPVAPIAQVSKRNRPPVYEFVGWQLDTATRRLVSAEGIEVALSGGAYDLLLAFLEHPQRVLSRDHLLDVTRNRSAEPFDRSIDVQVSRLRQKLEVDAKDPKIIKTVRTGGYLFTAAVKRVA